jgi:hypothetical protein
VTSGSVIMLFSLIASLPLAYRITQTLLCVGHLKF